jgi:tetratricopeptide (TPR) repeat protein
METDNQSEIYEEYRSNFKEGIAAYNNKDYLRASEFFKTLVNKYPDDPDVHINLGNAFFKMENIDGAIFCWQKAKELDAYNVKTYINIGNLYFTQSKTDKALKEWENALLVSPTNPTVLINIASTFEKNGNKKKAFRFYEFFLENSVDKSTSDYKTILKKISMHKVEALKQMKKGAFFQKRQQYRNAVQFYLNSIKSYPVFKNGYLNMGNVCYILEKYENAVDYWLESYLLGKNQPDLCLNLALSYEKLEKYIDSYCFLDRFIRKTDKNTIDFINAQQKIKILKEIIDKAPEMLIKYREQSETLLKEQNFEQALIRFENLYIITDDNDVFEKITKIKVEIDPLLRVAVIAFQAGKKYKTEGNVDKAVEFFKKCQLLWPDGYYSKQAAEIITECGKIMGNAVTAIMKVKDSDQ